MLLLQCRRSAVDVANDDELLVADADGQLLLSLNNKCSICVQLLLMALG